MSQSVLRFSLVLRHWMAARDLDRATLCRCLDLPLRTVAAWQAGTALPEPGHYDRLADTMDLSREKIAGMIADDVIALERIRSAEAA